MGLLTQTSPVTDMTPADKLRAAATQMRERAEKATPGPWTPMALGSEGYLVLRKHGTIRERGKGRVGRFGCKDWDADRADAEYVAAMHPLVALAVAGWLDETALDVAENLELDTPECVHAEPPCGCDTSPRWGCDRCGGWLGSNCHCWDDALAVARTYLGESDG